MSLSKEDHCHGASGGNDERALGGPLGKLSAELRIKIFSYTLKEDEPVKLKRLMFPPLLLVAGLFDEALYAWLTSNVFRIEEGLGLAKFKRMLTTFNAFTYTSALEFPIFSSHLCAYLRLQHPGSPAPISDCGVYFDFMQVCSNLRVVRLSLHDWHIQCCGCLIPITSLESSVSDAVVEWELNQLFTLACLQIVHFEIIEESLGFRIVSPKIFLDAIHEWTEQTYMVKGKLLDVTSTCHGVKKAISLELCMEWESD